MISILDTTLRDGEQTAGVSFNVNEKLAIARLLLEDLKADRIEVASARVSSGEQEAFARICEWAAGCGRLDRIEALGFVDGGESVDWIHSAGGKVVNILTKGSLKHLQLQLRKTPAEHLGEISAVVEYAVSKGLECNVYLEDWSNGMKDSPEYVMEMMDGMLKLPVRRFMLPDTLGVLSPWQTYEFCRQMVTRYPGAQFDFHAHNDYGMAVANSLSAIRAGISGLHCTVNGLGERSGNTAIATLAAAIKDLAAMETGIDESRLTHVCKYVESLSGIRIPVNEPVVGENVFTQSSGVHADGDRKGNLYANALLPQRFGRERTYALGKLSGKANISENLSRLGMSLTPEQIKLVTAKVVELGDKKEALSMDDLPFIVADVLKSSHSAEENIRVVNYALQLARGMKPAACVKMHIHGKEYESASNGDGQYNAFMNALWKIYDKLGKKHPVLVDYHVTIPPGGKTDALVSTSITWDMDGHSFKTRGIDSDQTEAAIKATIKMLNLLENQEIKILK